ncbi:pentatricopeptide repeat-containing protein At1g63070, mitochondrial-like [Olea europaea var. sylvestris]|uniref:pentatricopeptide repeat-containing protein At1g63070, mitochondrial-like n=1 Tax=Olea europaea var. sylvestris TaxID=158386 RepID=UPI000C1D3185|nr:pentatricopeptide repeat-containing protein At1g63070, mitochondrial-like [Olea europaea var. sylvestris]
MDAAKRINWRGFNLKEDMVKQGISPDIITYTLLMHGLYGFYNAKEDLEATSFFKMLLRHNIEPNFVVYNILIKAYSMKGNRIEALKLRDEMRSKGLQPDVFCYTALIRDFYKLGQIDEIKSLFQERLSCNVQPNKITYAVVIDGYSSWIIRNKLLSEMIGKGMDPDSVTYNTLTNGFCNKGKVKEAFNLWDHISHRGLKLDEVAHTSLVHCLPQASEMLDQN